jgi:hypothetical protein
LASYDFTIVYGPGNLIGTPDDLSRLPEYDPEKVNRSENGPQLISLVLKGDHFISEVALEGIGMQIVISGSKFH